MVPKGERKTMRVKSLGRRGQRAQLEALHRYHHNNEPVVYDPKGGQLMRVDRKPQAWIAP